MFWKKLNLFTLIIDITFNSNYTDLIVLLLWFTTLGLTELFSLMSIGQDPSLIRSLWERQGILEKVSTLNKTFWDIPKQNSRKWLLIYCSYQKHLRLRCIFASFLNVCCRGMTLLFIGHLSSQCYPSSSLVSPISHYQVSPAMGEETF